MQQQHNCSSVTDYFIGNKLTKLLCDAERQCNRPSYFTGVFPSASARARQFARRT
jgi:hypothetical protein